MAEGAMNAGAAAATVGGAALETSGHAVAYGACTVVGQGEAAEAEKRKMDRAADAVKESAAAVACNTEPWLDLDNSHNCAPWMTRWMSGVSDGRRLCDLFLPGTHDSVARIGGDFAECQCWDMPKQLRMGLRYFDVRVKHDGDDLKGCHGIIDMNITFREVASHCEWFVQNNPSEAVVVAISTKGSPKTDAPHSRDFLNEVLNQSQTMPPPRHGSAANWHFWPGHWPTLGQSRGKVLLFIGNGWPGCTDVQDVWDIGDGDEKFNHIMNHARKARAPGTLMLNYTSCTGQEGLTYATPKRVAVHVNKLVNKELEEIWKDARADIGPTTFMMDFPGVELVKLIITKNGPGVVKKAIASERSEDIAAKFREWDQNGDGVVSADELLRIFSSLDPSITSDTVNIMLNAADANKDGRIQYEEFLAWIMDKPLPEVVASRCVEIDSGPGAPATHHVVEQPEAMTFTAMKDTAAHFGGQLMQIEQIQAVLEANGPLAQADMWAACWNSACADNRDWIQIGVSGHPLGRSHCQHFGYPPWGDDPGDRNPWHSVVVYFR